MALVFAAHGSLAQAATPPSSTVEGAQALALGGTSGGGGHHIDFWTVQLVGGDRVVLHVKQPLNNGGYRFELYAPGTSETQFGQSPPAAFATTAFSGAEEVATTLQAPYSGDFLLAVCQNADRVGGEDCHSVGAGTKIMEAYSFTATLENGGITGAAAEDETRASSLVVGAPELKLGAFEAGGGNHVDFWAVQLVGGDRVVLHVKQPLNNGGYRFELYAPGTTESQFGELPPASFATTDFSGAEEVTTTLQAPYSGDFVLAVCQNADRVGGEDCHSVGAGSEVMSPYTFSTSLENGGVTGAAAEDETRASSSVAGVLGLKLGAFEAGGGNHVDFWAVQLVGGDRVVLHVKQPLNNGGYRFELYAPGTSETQFEQSSPAAYATTSFSGAEEVATTLQAPYSGDFVLAVCQNADRVGSEDCHSVGAAIMEPYTFSTTVEGPQSPPSPLPLPPPAVGLHLGHGASVTVTGTGIARVAIVCEAGPCSGTITLTVRVKHSYRVGKHRKIKTEVIKIGKASYVGVANGSHIISVKLDRLGIKLMKRAHYTLKAVIALSYTSGTVTKRASVQVVLEAIKPKHR